MVIWASNQANYGVDIISNLSPQIDMVEIWLE